MSKATALSAAVAQLPMSPQSEAPASLPEVVKTGETSESKPEQPLESTRFAHLAKKEAELVKRDLEWKKEREEFLKEKDLVEQIKSKANEFETTKSKDPIAALKMLGFSETDLFNFLSAQDLSPEQKAEKAAMTKIQEFEDRQKKAYEEQIKSQEEAQAKRDAEAIDGFKKSINQEIANQKDKYEYVNFYGQTAEELVFETIQEVFKAENKVIPVNEALDLVENYYEEMAKDMTTKINKLKPKEQAVAEAKEKLTQALRPEVNPMPQKTLSSKTNATVASTVTQKETPQQKRDRLIRTLGSLGKS